MRPWLVVLASLAILAGAQGVRVLAQQERDQSGNEEPFAPSAAAAPVVSLGYRELAADLLFFRLVGYFGGSDATALGVAGLVEAIVAMDPNFRKIYEWGGRAMVATHDKVDNALAMRAIRILEAGIAIYPDDYKLPKLAGEMYLFDLQTKDPAQKREWNERAARLLESAIRKPGAPASIATLVAHLRSKLGQHQRAVDGLREMLLITSDEQARQQLLDKLAELEHTDSAEVASELFAARKQFEATWRRERPSMPPSMYLIIGPVAKRGFDLGELATGGRELVDAQFERLESLGL